MTNDDERPKPRLTGQGGPGRGQGRKPGSINRLQLEAREAAQLAGKLPHEILLEMARGLPAKIMVDSGSRDENGDVIFVERYQALDVEQMKDAAKAAAPYYAPKLSTVETIAGLTDEQLDQIIAGAAAEAEAGAGVLGESQEDKSKEPTCTTPRIRIKT